MLKSSKPYKLWGIQEETRFIVKNEMVTIDFLCAMILLARISNNEKLRLFYYNWWWRWLHNFRRYSLDASKGRTSIFLGNLKSLCG